MGFVCLCGKSLNANIEFLSLRLCECVLGLPVFGCVLLFFSLFHSLRQPNSRLHLRYLRVISPTHVHFFFSASSCSPSLSLSQFLFYLAGVGVVVVVGVAGFSWSNLFVFSECVCYAWNQRHQCRFVSGSVGVSISFAPLWLFVRKYRANSANGFYSVAWLFSGRLPFFLFLLPLINILLKRRRIPVSTAVKMLIEREKAEK